MHALDRISNFFPDTAQKQLRSDLSSHLRAIVSQRLAIGKDGRRVAVVEIMLNTPLIEELIYQGRSAEVHDAMIQARPLGCQTFEDHLYELVTDNRLTPEEALHHADSRTNLALRFRLEGTGQEGSAGVVARDVAYARSTRFADFNTYRLRALRGSEDDPQRTVIEKGIRQVMGLKGLQESSNQADLEVRYAVCRSRRDLAWGAVESPVKAHTATLTDADIAGGLCIAIVDTAIDRAVWSLVASRRLFDSLEDPEQLGSTFLDLFSEFPPLQV